MMAASEFVAGACRDCSGRGYHDLYVADQSVRFWTVALALAAAPLFN
jgi:hypothetical protein